VSSCDDVSLIARTITTPTAAVGPSAHRLDECVGEGRTTFAKCVSRFDVRLTDFGPCRSRCDLGAIDHRLTVPVCPTPGRSWRPAMWCADDPSGLLSSARIGAVWVRACWRVSTKVAVALAGFSAELTGNFPAAAAPSLSIYWLPLRRPDAPTWPHPSVKQGAKAMPIVIQLCPATFTDPGSRAQLAAMSAAHELILIGSNQVLPEDSVSQLRRTIAPRAHDRSPHRRCRRATVDTELPCPRRRRRHRAGSPPPVTLRQSRTSDGVPRHKSPVFRCNLPCVT
jgi:hypothetical protein